MPTENRSPNISASRALLEQLHLIASGQLGHINAGVCPDHVAGHEKRDDDCPVCRVLIDLDLLLAQPADQHQADPIAWMVGSAIWWSKPEAEADSDLVGEPVIPIGPPADAGAVERLRLEIEQLKFSLQMHDDASVQDDCVRSENRTLHAQLAERDALLRESSVFFQAIAHKLKGFHKDNPGKWCGYLDDALGAATWQQDKIDTAIPASAEPSATASCIWIYNEDSLAWDTTCSESFMLMEDGPKENCMKFCPYCSKPITQAESSFES